MGDFWTVLLQALLPAGGNFAGGILAELVPVSRAALSLALHGAAGVIIAVVSIELMPVALNNAPGWIAILGFVLGGAFYVLLEAVVGASRERLGAEKGTGAWMIYAAVAIDLFSDGLVIGTSSVISFSLALLLALGQVTADIPEGFAAIASFKGREVSRGKRLMLSASFALPALLGAGLGYWLLRGQGETLKFAALAFTAGLLLVAAVEEMITEAHETAEDTRLSVAFFVGGFALFALVATYFD